MISIVFMYFCPSKIQAIMTGKNCISINGRDLYSYYKLFIKKICEKEYKICERKTLCQVTDFAAFPRVVLNSTGVDIWRAAVVNIIDIMQYAAHTLCTREKYI